MQINWKPDIGDPTIIGWLTVVAYFIAFLLCVVCATRLKGKYPTDKNNIQHRLWWSIALVLLLLGINKQLDFQTLLTEVGKVLAKRQGWYEQRRIVQTFFITGVISTCLFSLLVAWRTFRTVWKENWLALTGMVFLVSFVVIRASSFHGIDSLLGLNLVGFKINWLLELGGIICIWVAALINVKRNLNEKKCDTEQQLNFI